MNEKKIRALKLDQYKALREIVLETLKEAIIQHVIKPGERLMESRLADDMGVSRTPIREAIRQLVQEGYLILVPRKGVYVSEISLNDINEVFEIRAALEVLAISLAVERAMPQEIEQMKRCLVREAEVLNDDIIKTVEADSDLHNLIYQASRNERLMVTLSKLREQIYRMRVVTTALPGKRVISLGHHRELVEAISRRDIEQAEKIACEHIQLAEESLIQYFKAMSKDDKPC